MDLRGGRATHLAAYRREARIMRVIEEVSRYNEDVRSVRTKRDDYLAARLESAIARLQAEGVADKRIDPRYAATALGGMVARFAETMFVVGGGFDFEKAVEQLTLLWANALGLGDEPTPGRTRRKTTEAVGARA